MQLQVLVAGGGLELKLMPCACPAGTEGTPDCNYGRACGHLRSYARDVGGMMIQYVLARPYVVAPRPVRRGTRGARTPWREDHRGREVDSVAIVSFWFGELVSSQLPKS